MKQECHLDPWDFCLRGEPKSDLQRQLRFITTLLEREAKKNHAEMTGRLSGFLAIERTLKKLCCLEEIGAEITAKSTTDLLNKQHELFSRAAPFTTL